MKSKKQGRGDARGSGRRPSRKNTAAGRRPREEQPLRFSVTITDLTQEGQSVGHLSAADLLYDWDGTAAPIGEGPFVGVTIFTDAGLPGDVVLCESQKRKKSVWEAHTVRILDAAAVRRAAPCPYAEVCDGCGIMAWDPQEQKAWKMQTVRAMLTHTGGLAEEDLPDFDWIGAEEAGYRNKVNLRVTPEGTLGYTRRGTHDVFAVNSCFVAMPAIQECIAQWNALASALTGAGRLFSVIRMVILRANEAGESMCALVTDPISDANRQDIFEALKPLGFSVLCAGAGKRPGDIRLHAPLYYATKQTSLQTTLSGLTFSISPESFFQVNRFVTPQLYARAISYFDRLSEEAVLDLYCGTGTTSLFLAQHAGFVRGVEVVEAAVRDAEKNALRHGVDNVDFIAARAEDVTGDLTRDAAHPARLALVDPPRKGLDRAVRDAMVDSALEEIVYISCNPATFARDVKDFVAGGFRVRKISVADMFANSVHTESIAFLVRA